MSVTLIVEFNCITCVLVTRKIQLSLIIWRIEENDSKYHFLAFISKYLSSFTFVSLRSIDYFPVSRGHTGMSVWPFANILYGL